MFCLLFLSFNIQTKSQCVLTTVDLEGFEYTTACPDVIVGTIYHVIPQTYAVHNGARSLYLNFVNNLAPGTLCYERFYSVCPNQTYQISVWLIETYSGSNNITLNIVDGSGPVLDTWSGIVNSGAWMNWVSNLVIPISNTISYQVISNYMPGSNDMSMDNLKLSMCTVPEYDDGNFQICQSSNPVDLYDSLSLVTSINGTWDPPILGGGYLGTFNPSVVFPGTYTYTVAGTSVCPDSTVTLTVGILPSPSPSINVDVPFCDGGTLTLVDASSYPSWIWSTTETSQTIDVSTGGNYSVTVSDTSGCEGIASVLVTLPPSNVIGSFVTTQVACFGESSGAINLTPSGGTTPYSFQWSTGSLLKDLSNLTANIYTVTITDDHNCKAVAQVEVTQPNELIINLSGTDLSCHGDTNAFANAVVSGGVFPYIYNWNTGAITSGVTNMAAGIYSVTVTDGNYCIATADIEFEEPNPIQMYTSGDQTICLSREANIVGNSFGGTLPYVYHWTPGGYSTASIWLSPTESTEYCVYVDDANGCQSTTKCVTVFVNPALEFDLSIDKDTICKGDTVYLSSEVSGGNGGPYFLELYNGPILYNPQMMTPNETKKYVVLASDGCGTPQRADTVSVTVFDAPLVSFRSNILKGCEPLRVEFHLNIIAPGVKYFWDFDDSPVYNFSVKANPVHLFRDPGIYDISLSVESEVGCKSSYTERNMITVYPKPRSIFSHDPEAALISDPRIYFLNESELAFMSLWNFGDGDSIIAQQPGDHVYEGSGQFLVSLITESINGCRDTTYQWVTIDNINTFYSPNAIQPFSGYRWNQVFKPAILNLNPETYELFIYDRWGELIFQSNNYEQGWDGRIDGEVVKQGSYIWMVRYRDMGDNSFQKTGSVTVVY